MMKDGISLYFNFHFSSKFHHIFVCLRIILTSFCEFSAHLFCLLLSKVLIFFFLPPKTSLYIGDMGPLSVLYDAHRFSQLVIFLLICLMLFFAKQKLIFIVVIFINHLFWIFELKLPFLYIEVVYRRVPFLVFALLFFFLTVIPAVPLGWVLGCGVRSLCPVDCPVVHNPFTVKRLSSPQ